MSLAAPGRQTISACVIACDEERRLPACLDSLAFCDEIVVVDSGSRDRTVEIARGAGARVVESPWPGFGAQRNVAIDASAGDWVLEVDADERVTPPLRDEILAFLGSRPEVDVVGVPLRQVLLGHALGPSSLYPMYRLRMFRRGTYRHDERRTVHEGLWPAGTTWPFSGDLEHLLAGSWHEAVTDAWRYARLEALQQPPPTHRAILAGLLARPPLKLVYRLLAIGGWRDGWPGLVKIGLDCASDMAVWGRLAAGERRSETELAGHFSDVPVNSGSPKVVVAAAGAAASGAERWLREAAGGGADAVLITDAPVPGDRAVRVRRVERMTPLRLLRALESETQLRKIDTIYAADARSRRMARLVPGGIVRGAEGPLPLAGTSPAAAVTRVARARGAVATPVAPALGIAEGA